MQMPEAFLRQPWRPNVLLAALFALVVAFGLLEIFGSPVANSQGRSAERPSALQSLRQLNSKIDMILKLNDSPTALAWSPNGKLLATADSIDRRITIWDSASGTKLHTIYKTRFGIRPLLFTPDNRYVVTSAIAPKGTDNRVSLSLIDVSSGQVATEVLGPVLHPTDPLYNIPKLYAISKQGNLAATITDNGDADLINFYQTTDWSLISSHPLIGSAHDRGSARDIVFDSSQQNVIVLGVRGSISVWRPVEDHPSFRFQAFTSTGQTLALNDDGDKLAASQGQGIAEDAHDADALRLWDTHTWALLAGAPAGPGFRARSLSFSADGRYLASFSFDDKIRIWTGESLKLIGQERDGGRDGIALSFAPDGNRLAIARAFEIRIVTIQ
jgi:WD40 repeat protein